MCICIVCVYLGLKHKNYVCASIHGCMYVCACVRYAREVHVILYSPLVASMRKELDTSKTV